MRIILLTIIVLSPLILLGQRCWEVRDESIDKFVSLYEAGEMDSVHFVIKDWMTQCEITEELFRIRVLNCISRNEDLNAIIDGNALGYVRSYISKDLESLLPYYFSFTYENYEANEIFNQATAVWANSLTPQSPIEEALLKLYGSNDYQTIWEFLKSNKGANSNLQTAFNRIVSESKFESEFYMSAQIGGFLHLKSHHLGPRLGIQIGKITSKRMGIFSTFIRPGRSEKIEVTYKNKKQKIGVHSLYLGYDYGLWNKASSFDYGSFISVSHSFFLTKYETEESKKIVPAVFSLGVGFVIEWPLSYKDNIGIELRATPINLSYKEDIGFNASSISIGLKWSSRTSRIRQEFLQPVDFYD